MIVIGSVDYAESTAKL